MHQTTSAAAAAEVAQSSSNAVCNFVTAIACNCKKLATMDSDYAQNTNLSKDV